MKLKDRLVSKKLLKQTPRATIVVEPIKPAEYENKFFKEHYEKERRKFFFK